MKLYKSIHFERVCIAVDIYFKKQSRKCAKEMILRKPQRKVKIDSFFLFTCIFSLFYFDK